MFRKLFYTFALVALLVAALPLAVSAKPAVDDFSRKQLAYVTKYKVLDDQPMTFQFKGYIACDKANISGYVSGKSIYVTIGDDKRIGGGKACDNTQGKGYTKAISFGSLIPGNYTVYVNADANGKAQRKFKVIAPLLPTPTAPAP